jgi:DUF2971 family protein
MSSNIRVLLEHILPTNKLKAGRYINTNDPKESKNWFFTVGTNTDLELGKYDLQVLSDEMTRGMKHKTNVLCFSQDRELTGNHIEDIHNRGFCRPRMWAQYAENHAGVYLIFSRETLQRAVDSAFPHHRIYEGPVIYINRSSITDFSASPYIINADYLERYGKQKYLEEHIHTYYKRLFFEKCEVWRDEVEYRWVLFGDDEQDLFCDFQGALRGIVFGVSCSEGDIECIVSLCRQQRRQMWFEQLEWKGCAPWVSFLSLKLSIPTYP